MHGYKYPARWLDSSEDTELRPSPSAPRTETRRETRRFKMLCSRFVLPVLAVYLLLEEISAAVLPSRFRNKREVNWQDRELFPRPPDRLDQGDLSVGEAETFLVPTEHFPLQYRNQNQNQNQYQYQRKANEKRRKVAPLDSIGGFQMSTFRTRKDEPDLHWEEYRD